MRGRVIVAWLTLAALLASCRSGADFVERSPLEITEPGQHERVALPLQVAWEFDGSVPDDAIAAYVVLVDKNPQPPGRSLVLFLPDDGSCVGSARAACLTQAGLQAQGVHLTTTQQVSIPQIPPRVGVSKGSRNLHDITVVPVDDEGFRVGEWSAQVTVRVEANE